MRSRFLRSRPRRLLPAAALLLLALTLAGLAVAATPKKGATYSGLITRVIDGSSSTFPISFQVSANGKKVRNFTLESDYPIYCEGGGFGEAQKATATISKQGTFTAKLPLYFAPSHQHQGFVEISGKFGKKGHESGKVVTDFTTGTFTGCNGTSKYTTKAR